MVGDNDPLLWTLIFRGRDTSCRSVVYFSRRAWFLAQRACLSLIGQPRYSRRHRQAEIDPKDIVLVLQVLVPVWKLEKLYNISAL